MTSPHDTNPAADAHAEGDDVALARRAAQGDADSRRRVTLIADPIIRDQTDRFCKRFCKDNRFRYTCTLPSPWGGARKGAPLCEWGNASYAWMLDDLTAPPRLQRYEGTHGARLRDYLFHIANSLPFYERWKNWRFGRRVHVPTYVRDMDADAAKIFLALRSGDHVALIAQKLARAEAEVDALAQRIVIELTRRRRLHLLNPAVTVSLTGLDTDDDDDATARDADVASEDPAPEMRDARQRLARGWAQLDAVEQFVLEAMVVEEQDANDVLDALRRLDLSISPGVPAANTDRQQLYYFRRKTLAKLTRLSGLVEEE